MVRFLDCAQEGGRGLRCGFQVSGVRCQLSAVSCVTSSGYAKKETSKIIAQVDACGYICKQILAYMEMRRDVFQAIADPTRRAIIGMIAAEPANINSIAERFDITRQAVSLHLKILAECGLMTVKQNGRERICEARLEKLNEVNAWLDQYRRFWETKLDALGQFLDDTKNSK